MNKVVPILVLSLLVIFKVSIAKAAIVVPNYSSEPKMFVQELVNDAINKLSDINLTKEEKVNYIEILAVNNVDIDALSLYTLGELRKSADKDSLKRYQSEFKKYFLKTLTSRLTDYSSNKFEVLSAEKKSSNYTIVSSKIVGGNNQPEIKIDWRIYTKNPDNPLIRDLIIEGLSLARTQKEEFSSILNSNDGDINALFKTLEEFSNN